MSPRPNVVFVFADQWRAQAFGYAGDPNVRTPHIDALAASSVNFHQAISGIPVCCPYRACLLTGQRPLTHGVFLNDVCLRPKGVTLGEAFASAGYQTGYIGKWHLDGHGRSQPIPPERRLGFDYWKVLECSHDYNRSAYYEDDFPDKRHWEGYDAFAQTRDAREFIRGRAKDGPFFLMLSWGPPHSPYDTAPPEFQALYDADKIRLRPNVPESMADQARQWLKGYYAHCAALDQSVGDLLETLDQCGIADETIFVFTSDHGDMLGSQGETQKQRPWEESIRVPFLLRHPGYRPAVLDTMIDAPDIMPTLLGLCGLSIPEGVEGCDYSDLIKGGPDPSDGVGLLTCPHPFGQWSSLNQGGREFRGVRTQRHVYIRDLNGPWLLYDLAEDPFQMKNLVGDPRFAVLQRDMENLLQGKLEQTGDLFLPGREYVDQWGYSIDHTGTVPYTD